VAISGDASTVLVGGPRDNSGVGAAWVSTGPTSKFAGIPGSAECYLRSVATLIRDFEGLATAAEGLGYRGIPALERAILRFCEDPADPG
jgi:hypothetical protein